MWGLALLGAQLSRPHVRLFHFRVGKTLGRDQDRPQRDLEGQLLLRFFRRRRQLGEHLQPFSRQGRSFLVGEDSGRALGGDLEEFRGPRKITRRLEQQRGLVRNTGLRARMEP